MRYKEFYNQYTGNCIYISVSEKAIEYDQNEEEYETENTDTNYVDCINEFNKTDYIQLFKKLKNVDNICIKLGYLDIDLENPMNTNIGVFYTSDYPIKYNIIQGRFFTKEDITSNKKMLVVGKDILEKAVKENGNYYMMGYGQEKIPIVGVIGNKDGNSIYDEYIFYNLNAFIEDIRDIGAGEWKLYSNKYNSVELKKLIDINKRDDCLCGEDSSIGEMQKTSYALSSTIDGNKDMFISFGIVLLTIIIALIQSIIYWLNRTRVELGVRRQAGASNLRIIGLVIKRFYIVEFLALTTASLMFCVYDKLLGIAMLRYIDSKSIIIIILFLIVLGVMPIVRIRFILNNNSIATLVKDGSK